MKIYNGTPHPIKIVDKDSCKYDARIRKWVSENPLYLMEIPPDNMLSATIETVKGESLCGIPIFHKKIAGYDFIPTCEICIVSQLYASAIKIAGAETNKIYTVADPVYSLDGRTILGSLGICPAF